MFVSAVSKIWEYLEVSIIFKIEFEFWTHVSGFRPAEGRNFLSSENELKCARGRI